MTSHAGSRAPTPEEELVRVVLLVVEVAALLVVGWVAGAETGSWCCVQPPVAGLPYAAQVAIEQAMLRTFGRVMPVLMPLSGVLAVALAVLSRGGPRPVLWLRAAAAACIAVTVVTTLTVNVPINTRTARWPAAADAAEWSRMRARWHAFQGVRAGLFLAAFVLLAVAGAVPRGAPPQASGGE